MIDRFSAWQRATRPLVVDLTVALACFLLASPLAVAFAYIDRAPVGWSVVALAVSCVPLIARNRWPVTVVAVTVSMLLVQSALLPLARPTPAATAVALYTVAIRTGRRRAWRVGTLAAVVLITASLVFPPGALQLPQSLARPESLALADKLPSSLALIAWTLMAVAIGDAVRSRREVLAAAVERAERAERTKEEEARRRVIAERLRIARELHDVVAHHITLVNAQAGVAHHLMGTDPEHAYQALERIRDTSRGALDELRATVGLLRYGEDPDEPREPAPGLAGLDALLDSFRHSGLDVTLERTGPPGELSPIADLTAYRIIQEALTNTHKHAGPASAGVRLDFRTDVLRLTVEDDGRGTGGSGRGTGPGATGLEGTQEAGTGHGMIGMRERARSAGGTLAAGPRPEGGFRIEAELPLHAGRKGRP
ncbi:histidine kinase [Streptomyces libani]|uniref:histidine kinase n=2 Tax=Streptomyces nigrescens TaxID=1920 RepID=A0A640TJ64_STRNI|nr:MULTISPECIES: histidine kinase [Streptomyces]MCX5444557.1 histidine kinase [Streptomyces libani]WAU01816.1 histidine kinase [Streptomyces libani subsp. libani]WAU09698.1 histidine kinase [Streptomyces nigrescens]WDT60017.1 histidine kinase [Streptomyces sp. G7(2002)]GFE23617.1 two-component sensor histidine kinase [Streptomyces libani subsp. libani]